MLAHHAEGAGDAAAVLRHAPEAARRSAELGSHREAAAQYERALRFADGIDTAELALLREGLAYELSLVDRWEEAEERQEALRLWRQVGNAEKIGQNLRWLSRCLWRLCRGAEANDAAAAALQVLEPLPPAPELAWAYANLALQRVQAGDVRDGIRLAEKARDLAERLAEPEILSHALNTMGCAYAAMGRAGGTCSSAPCRSPWMRASRNRSGGPTPTCMRRGKAASLRGRRSLLRGWPGLLRGP